MIGAGKYDPECTVVRESTGASTVLLIVIGGDRGIGFSMQTDDQRTLFAVPDILEGVAAQIRKDLK